VYSCVSINIFLGGSDVGAGGDEDESKDAGDDDDDEVDEESRE
jgi:hypothetical protein